MGEIDPWQSYERIFIFPTRQSVSFDYRMFARSSARVER